MDIHSLQSNSEATDELLAANVAGGDVFAFGELYDRHIRSVYGLSAHVLGADYADEAVQEIFLRLWNRATQFDPARGSFGTWLLAIARHYLFDQLRRRRLEHRLLLAQNLDILIAVAAGTDEDVAERSWREERARAVRAALMNIPEEQRQVLYLSYFLGLSQSAIAHQLNTPLGTIKKRVQLGMRKLKANLENLSAFHDDRQADAKGGAVR